MNELYQKFRPAFSSEVFKAALREVVNVRQAHAAAAVRGDDASVEFALKNLECLHRFTAAQAEVFRMVEPAAVEEVGYVSLVMFGTDPRVFQFMLMALNDVEVFSREAYNDLVMKNQRPNMDAILAGDGSLTDALIWMHHMGTSTSKYLVEWTVATTKENAERAYNAVLNA
jgi:hypothetical protein